MGQIVTKKRNCLKEDIIEAIVFVNTNLNMGSIYNEDSLKEIFLR
jgi:hypothetical protein